MGKYKQRILLAVDGSDQAFEAVRYVSQLFPPNRLEVVLFHVTSKIPESFWDIEKNPTFRHQLAPVAAWAVQQQTAIQEFMEKSRQLFVEQGVPEEAVSIKSQERQVGIARDIVREAQKDYDSVVVGRWGVSKLKDLVWGSIANKLVGHLTHIPLCVVGGAPEAGKILVALDTSEEGMGTVDYLGTMVDGTDWGITLFHVIRGLDFVLPETGEILQDIEGAVKALLEQAVGRLEKAGLRPEQISTKTASGVASRAKAIVEEGKNGGYGTIVIGRRGLSRVEEFFMGSVSSKVMQLAQEMAVWVVS
ncbi:MAG: universal stress protein [Syntrophobacteria bacterium]